MTTAQELVTNYLEWLQQNMTHREVGDWVEISTPFLDRHRDHLLIYVKAEGDRWTLSDDGYILNDLISSGCDVTSPRRKEMLEQIVRGHGVTIEGDELTVQATASTFAQRKHALLQAMLAVNDLFFTNRTAVRGLFMEEVEHFLVEHQIRFVPTVQFSGKSGLSHTFDYVIPAWNRSPERVLKTMNQPSKEKIQSMLFAWNDVREIRKGIKLYAVVNDQEKRIPNNLVTACVSEGVNILNWSRRAEYLEELTA